MFNQSNSLLLVIDNNEGANAILDQEPVITPITKANADECKEFTGFSIGGVSPIAHDNIPKSIFIDTTLSKYKKVFAAAGHPFVVFGVSYSTLCDLTKGSESNII